MLRRAVRECMTDRVLRVAQDEMEVRASPTCTQANTNGSRVEVGTNLPVERFAAMSTWVWALSSIGLSETRRLDDLQSLFV
jgi:hypothetical protein